MLLIQNGRVLDPYTDTDAPRDVQIGEDGVIAQVAERIEAPAGCTVYDAAGLTVSPGFVDGHVPVSYTHLDVYKRQAQR